MESCTFFVYNRLLLYSKFMKILFISPAIEEKSRGIGAIFRSLVESAKKDDHDISLVLGYPEARPFIGSSAITDKLEHLYAQHYLKDGWDSFKYIAKRNKLKLAILEGFASLSIFRVKTIDVNSDYLSGPKTLLNDSDHIVKAPFFFFSLNYLPSFLAQMIVNRIVRVNNIDLVVISAPTMLSNKKTPALVAHFVHDTMPLDLIEAPPSNKTPVRYAKQFQSTCNNSDLIFTNSEDTANKVLSANPDANTHVLYGTASSRREDVQPGKIMELKKLKKGNFLLFTSTVEKRKNVESLLKAYSLIHAEINMPLIIVGAQGYGYDDVIETYKSLSKDVQRKIHFLGYVSEADKFQLFDNAFAFVFPSVYEGMGLMLIEAMQAGIPIITSRKGALPEAGGDAVYYIEDPYDVEEISGAILTLKNDPKLVQKLVKKGRSQQKKFTFEKFTERFSIALKSLDATKTRNTKAPSYPIPIFKQLLYLNRSELIIVAAIFLNSFNYWPSFNSSLFGSFSFELSMISGLLLIVAGLTEFGSSLFKKLSATPLFIIPYLWVAYGLTIGYINNADSLTSSSMAKGVYLLSVVAGGHVAATLYANKKVSITNILRGWSSAAILLAPVLLAQYVLVSLGVDSLSKNAYQVGVFEFPRLHGFSFEPLFLANWLLVPTVFTLLKDQSSRLAVFLLPLLVFLTLGRGAIYALIASLLVFGFTSRRRAQNIKIALKPLISAALLTLIFVGVSAQLNNSTALRGVFRYVDHLTLGVLNEDGANNIQYKEVLIEGKPTQVINTSILDKNGAVEASTVSRGEAINLSYDIFEDNRLTGVGLFRLGDEAAKRSPEQYADGDFVANSQPIDILAETGIIGITLLFSFVVLARKTIFRRNVISIALLALVLQYLFFTNIFLVPFWIIAAFAVVKKGSNRLPYE